MSVIGTEFGGSAVGAPGVSQSRRWAAPFGLVDAFLTPLRGMLLAVFGVAVAVAFLFSASPAYASGDVSLTINSLTRDATTGNLDYNISASGSAMTSDCAGTACYLALYGMTVDGYSQ